MTIKYANGWWGIYGADPFHVPKFKKFIDAIRWAKEHRGLEVPQITQYEYQRAFPNRMHIVGPRHRSKAYQLFWSGQDYEKFDTLAEAITAAHKLAKAAQ